MATKKKTATKIIEVEDEKYWSCRNVLATGANVFMVIGQRSKGKSYQILWRAVEDYMKTQRTTAWARRWDVDFERVNTDNLYNSHIKNGMLKKLNKECGTDWTDICYWSKAWYLCKYDDKQKRIRDRNPFMYAFSLNTVEHGKSGWNDPNCYRLVLEEFMPTSAQGELPDEWSQWQTLMSTVKRNKKIKDMEVWFLGNTLTLHSTYLKNFGISHIETQQPATIQIYKFKTFDVAVEMTGAPGQASEQDDFFSAFDDPMADMITTGNWHLANCCQLTEEMNPHDKNNIAFRFFIEFDDNTVQCDVCTDAPGVYVYAHKRTYVDRIDRNNEIIYTMEPDVRPNVRDTFMAPRDTIDQKIKRLYDINRFRYQDNFVGDTVHKYLQAVGM